MNCTDGQPEYPQKTGGPAPAEPAARYALAGALLLGGPVWHYLFVNHYPFRLPEALLLPLLAALLGAAAALAAHRRGGVLGSLVCGVLLYFFVDLQFDLDRAVPTLAVIAACLLASFVFRARRAVLACLVLGGLYLASLIRPADPHGLARPGPSGQPHRELPLLIHLVLDEQWGIGGLRAAGDPATADFLTNFYLQRGFEVYEGAYSRWPNTLESIPALVSLHRPVALQVSQRGEITLHSNPYFKRLRELGYLIRVYQSSYIDYCRAVRVPVASCQEAPANSIANISYLAAPWTVRAMLAGRYLLNVTSHLYDRISSDGPAWRRDYSGRGLAELRAIRDLIVAKPPGGTVVFIHLLLPHRPLTLNADCSLYADLSKRWSYGEPWPSTTEEQRDRLRHYGAQVRCVHRAIATLFAALDHTVGRDGAIVLVHGDHGSRWIEDDPGEAGLASMRGPQLNSAFSTLLAIRRPRVPAMLHPEAVPIQDFLWELVDRRFAGKLSEQWPQYVRHRRTESSRTDTRALSAREMPWLRQSP
jgi:hypothetical protein